MTPRERDHAKHRMDIAELCVERAKRRLCALHPDDYARLYRQERVRAGLENAKVNR